jgi:3-hydroxyacyl-[acyl-carrier-protein] dehydratase
MPPKLLFEISGIDLDKVLYGPEGIRERNPQRGDMEHLDAITHIDAQNGRIIGFKDVRENEFWVPGHLPGRPLLPGVIMIESGAQLSSFYNREVEKWQGFIGFTGATDIRFRIPVTPGKRLHLLGQKAWIRHGRFCSHIQGLVNGTIAFEASILGATI